jgi:hypothetical protein
LQQQQRLLEMPGSQAGVRSTASAVVVAGQTALALAALAAAGSTDPVVVVVARAIPWAVQVVAAVMGS